MLDPEAVHQARARIAGRVHVTPTMRSTRLGERVGVRLALKCESFQKTGSFKVRGALNKLSRLDAEARARGVVSVSAGNHAQALAWAAREEGIRCTVVMPAIASQAKAEASAGYGATVVRHGTSAEAFIRAHQLAADEGFVFIHPFDDPDICAGQGTLALEMVEQGGVPDIVVVPVGGGGLIAGVATALEGVAPDARIFGVEPAGAAAMRASLDAGRPERIELPRSIADGLAAPMAGVLPFEVVRRRVEDVVLVRDEEIAEAVGALLSWTKVLAEPAGAAGLAAILAGRIPLPAGAAVTVVVSGGNVDLARLRELL